jgi:hypothetical protein
MTLEENLGDLRRHAEDFAGRSGFTYTVLDTSGAIVGCVYIYPPAAARSADSDDAPDVETPAAQVRSWVSADRPELDVQLHDAVSEWLRTAWPFSAIDYAPR